jgi:hypothetical protein
LSKSAGDSDFGGSAAPAASAKPSVTSTATEGALVIAFICFSLRLLLRLGLLFMALLRARWL